MENSQIKEPKREFLSSPQYLDEQIRVFLAASQEERNKKWQAKEFSAIFPKFIKRVLSPQGLEIFSSKDRQEIFISTLETFLTLPWTPPRWWKHQEDEARQPIGALGLRFPESEEVFSRAGREHEEEVNTDSLMNTEIASVLLLGMSLDDEEQAMREVVEFYQRLGPKRGSFRQSLGLLLVRDNITRKWIKTNQLDVATGYEWDQQITELILNLPENVINPTKNLPQGLPKEMTYHLKTLYSMEAIDIFLDYAVIYVQSLPMTKKRADQIQDFTLEVRRLPEDFVLAPPTQAVLIQLRQAIIRQRLQPEPSPGKIPVARELLPQPPRILRIRWLNPEVKKLLS